MPLITLLDANGNRYNADTNNVGSNQAATIVLADSAGNKFTLAPGLVGLPVSSDGLKTTYYYAVLGYAPAATPTDVLQITGSGTKTVRVRRIKIGGIATAAGNMPVQIFRRSTADTGGTPTPITPVQADTTSDTPAAGTAVVVTFGANPSPLGTQVGGVMRAGRAQLSAAGSGVAANDLVLEFNIKAAVLRGTSQFLCINMNGAALPAGAAFDIEIITEEDGS